MNFDPYSDRATITDLIGKMFVKVESDHDSVTFINVMPEGPHYRMEHIQDCCESVELEDINGDLNDLVDTPILHAEEVSNADEPPKHPDADSYTWTFYKFRTAKGYVTLRWYGTSNGYYSEGVSVISSKKES